MSPSAYQDINLLESPPSYWGQGSAAGKNSSAVHQQERAGPLCSARKCYSLHLPSWSLQASTLTVHPASCKLTQPAGLPCLVVPGSRWRPAASCALDQSSQSIHRTENCTKTELGPRSILLEGIHSSNGPCLQRNDRCFDKPRVAPCSTVDAWGWKILCYGEQLMFCGKISVSLACRTQYISLSRFENPECLPGSVHVLGKVKFPCETRASGRLQPQGSMYLFLQAAMWLTCPCNLVNMC